MVNDNECPTKNGCAPLVDLVKKVNELEETVEKIVHNWEGNATEGAKDKLKRIDAIVCSLKEDRRDEKEERRAEKESVRAWLRVIVGGIIVAVGLSIIQILFKA